MYQKFCKAVRNMHKGQKGITGLETAIILIAFVTVASVLAYSVLSAGIYSSERGKAAVYAGLSSAQSTMSIKGSVVGKATGAALTSLTFNLALAISGDSIDLNNLVLNYWDSGLASTALVLDKTASGTATPTATAGDWSYVLTDGTASSILSGTLEGVITVCIPAGATVGSYDTFTIEVNPPTGASITLQRSLGPIAPIMTLN
jgi:archaeal flagellin FlaB